MKFPLLLTALQGLIVGITMLVPGVSGGSMAMILGAYDRLITAVSSFLQHKRASISFLLLFSIPALVGMVLFSTPLLRLIQTYPMPMMYLFIGAVVGGVPMIYRKAGVTRLSLPVFLYLMLGILCVLALAQLPEGLFSGTGSTGILPFLLQVLGGIVVAVALIFPGISVSYMLILLGLYEPTMTAIARLDVLALLPMAVGGLLGVLLTTRAIEWLMAKFPFATYLVILGFILGSVGQVFPGLPSGVDIPLCLLTLIFGFAAIWLISRREEQMSP